MSCEDDDDDKQEEEEEGGDGEHDDEAGLLSQQRGDRQSNTPNITMTTMSKITIPKST